MKKVLLTLAVVGLVTSIYAQGTISFNNMVGAAGRVELNGVIAPAATQVTVQLLYGPVGTPVGSLTPWASVYTSSLVLAGQFYDSTSKTLSGIPVGNGSADTTMNVTLAVQGWTGAWTSMAQALANHEYTGITAAFNNPTGGAGVLPNLALPANLVGWLGNNPLNLVIPEPSTFALLGLGALGMMLFRRK